MLGHGHASGCGRIVGDSCILERTTCATNYCHPFIAPTCSGLCLNPAKSLWHRRVWVAQGHLQQQPRRGVGSEYDSKGWERAGLRRREWGALGGGARHRVRCPRVGLLSAPRRRCRRRRPPPVVAVRGHARRARSSYKFKTLDTCPWHH